MKILTFSAYFTPEIAASMYLTENLLEGMCKAGHDVELFVPYPTRGISAEIRSEYSKKKNETKYDGHLKIHHFWLYTEGRNSLLRAFRYALLNLIFIWKGLWTKADVIFVQSTPPTQGLVSGFLRLIKRIPVVYNLQDIFPDSLVNTGLTKKGSILWKIGRKIEDFTYKNADKIIVISEGFKNNIMAKGVQEEKIEIIPNWVDTSDVYPVDRKDNILFDRYNIERNKFIISYCGNIGHTQNIDMLLDAVKELQDKLPQLLFVLIGDGAEKSHVEDRIINEHISSIMLLPFQPYEDIAHVFSLGDVGLIISKSGVGTNSVPSKTWSYLAAGRLILVSFDYDSNLATLVDRVGCGLMCNAGDCDAFIKAIRRLYVQTAQETMEMGYRGLEYVTKSLKKDKCVMEYVKTILQVFEDSQNISQE